MEAEHLAFYVSGRQAHISPFFLSTSLAGGIADCLAVYLVHFAIFFWSDRLYLTYRSRGLEATTLLRPYIYR